MRTPDCSLALLYVFICPLLICRTRRDDIFNFECTDFSIKCDLSLRKKKKKKSVIAEGNADSSRECCFCSSEAAETPTFSVFVHLSAQIEPRR